MYLKGRHWLGQRTRDAQKKALDYFTRAIELDPGYALAYDGLAQCYLLTFLQLAPRDRMPLRAGSRRNSRRRTEPRDFVDVPTFSTKLLLPLRSHPC